ncbi:inner membrane-spanning protein YciB [Cognatishimia sp. F0-27]|uniref:inner membrane-spanning protein YciB n=1 Tax=Cognatishimia sp. F0-27 TaxID=2816855 RepID=UPI001D0CD775|nr:inner membrane-spanning protein YciB [Cognatishimia sp. F0-27]MCC1492501.1 septation protein IspZ [Cognatishimia sp. F0-27]
MSQNKINPVLKSTLELGPVLGFFVAYLWLKDERYTLSGVAYDGFIIVTAAFIPIFLLAMGALWWLTGKLSKMQAVTAVMIVIFGGLTFWLNDERFIKVKPTLVYLVFGGLLGLGLLRGQSWLQMVMEELMPLKDEGWMILTRRFMWFFFAMAAANEAIWRTQSTETWVYLETFGFPVAVFVFFMVQSKLFSDYALEEESPQNDP